MSVHENLLRLRAKSGYTQEAIAQQLNVSRQSVAKWEAGKSTPDLDRLVILADLFDVSLDELVRGKAVGVVETEIAPAAQQEDDSVVVSELDEPLAQESEGVETSLVHACRAPAEPASSALAEDDYLAHMDSFARKIGIGVGLIILGSAFAVLFAFIGNLSSVGLPKPMTEAWAGISVIAFAAAGIACIVPAGLDHGDFQKRYPVLNFEFSELNLNEAKRKLAIHITVGIALIFVGVIIVIIFSMFDDTWESLSAALLLVCVAVGVEEIVYGGIRGSATEKREYETAVAETLLDSGHSLPKELDPMATAKARRNRIVGSICGIIMIIATIVGLSLLFTGDVALFWLAWPIGGLSCGIVSLAGDAILAAVRD